MKYQTKTLLSNWFEERCDPKSRNATTYTLPKYNDYNKATLVKVKFAYLAKLQHLFRQLDELPTQKPQSVRFSGHVSFHYLG